MTTIISAEPAAGRVPSNLAALVRRRAVLEPLAGPVEGDAGIAEASRRVAEQWRERVAALADAGLLELAGPRPKGGRAVGRVAAAKAARRRGLALACPSPFPAERPGGRGCGLYAACPHCWARLVERIWRGVDDALFEPAEQRRWRRARRGRKRAAGPGFGAPPRPPGPRRLRRAAGFDLLEWAAASDAPRQATYPGADRPYRTLASVLDGVVSKSVRWPLYLQRGVWGGLDAPVVVPSPVGWHVEVRRLLIIEAGSEPPPGWDAASASRGLWRLERPTREEALEAVARACRYPAALLSRAGTDQVAELIAGRRGRLVFATFGLVGGRGRHVEG